MGFGYDQVQIDIFVAVQLYSAVKGFILEDMVFQPQLLDDPGGCDRLQVPPSLSPGHSLLVIGTMVEEATKKFRDCASRGMMISFTWKGMAGSFSMIIRPSSTTPMLT